MGCHDYHFIRSIGTMLALLWAFAEFVRISDEIQQLNKLTAGDAYLSLPWQFLYASLMLLGTIVLFYPAVMATKNLNPSIEVLLFAASFVVLCILTPRFWRNASILPHSFKQFCDQVQPLIIPALFIREIIEFYN